MREKVGVVGVFALVAAVWVTGYLWQSGRIDLSTASTPAVSQGATPDAPAETAPGTTPDAPPDAAPDARPDTTRGTASAAGRTPASPRTGTGAGGDARSGVPGQQPGVGADEAVRQAQARADAAQPEQPEQPTTARPPVLDFRLATINVLGSTHTAGNAPRFARFASGTARVPGLVQVLRSRDIDVAGLQEFQPVQRAAFARRSSGWSTYPRSNSFDVGTTSMAWRTDRFALVEARLTAMPFYGGGTRMSPAVLLRDRATGVQFWATTVHNPADTGRYPRQQRVRNQATGRQVALVRQLGASGVPVLLTGDMNEKKSYYCRFTGATGFTSPGGRPGGCRPPAGSGIDWIFGSPALEWTSFVVDRSSLVRRTTDHPVRVAGVRVDAGDFAGAWTPPSG